MTCPRTNQRSSFDVLGTRVARRHRVAVGIEWDAKLIVGARRAYACQVKAGGVQPPQMSAFLFKTINRALVGRLVHAHVGHGVFPMHEAPRTGRTKRKTPSGTQYVSEAPRTGRTPTIHDEKKTCNSEAPRTGRTSPNDPPTPQHHSEAPRTGRTGIEIKEIGYSAEREHRFCSNVNT